MSVTNNSVLLQYLLDNAEKIKNELGVKILTANHLIIAVLDYVNNRPSIYGLNIDPSESEELCKIVNAAFSKVDIDRSKEILAGKKDSFIDDLLFRKNISNAQALSESSGHNSVSADILLKTVMEEPTDEIKQIINHTVKGETQEEGSTKLPKFDLGGLTGDLTKGKTTEEPSESSSSDDTSEAKPQTSVSESPKEHILALTKRTKEMQKALSNVVFGQDNAISIFTSGYFQAELASITDKNRRKPKATFLFAGPPGVGKTFLAEQVAGMLELPFKRFDMSEYSLSDAVMELCGTNESYKGAKKGELTGFVDRNPECVLLFDEIEKAHINVIHQFLQLLDAGRLRDINTEKEVAFSKAIVIFTTNAGRKIYEDSDTPNLSQISRKAILKALETDVDPKTGLGSFPAAICSRFATGNVVMFNHMEAHSLRKIAENEITKRADALEKETGIKCNINEDVYSCILFAEGGHADARTVTSRANAFFSTELYELFRLVSAESLTQSIENIEEININLVRPVNNEQAMRLFENKTKGCVLVFADDRVSDNLKSVLGGYEVISTSSLEEAKNVINKKDVELVLCDLHIGEAVGNKHSLNIEDIESDGRSFFRFACERCDAPLYVVHDKDHPYKEEEIFSLTREGARDVINAEATEELAQTIKDITVKIHHQQSMIDLARSSKMVTYETSQFISDDGKVAEIRLFDITLETSVDAEDKGSILSSLSRPTTRFSDVIGADDAKSELEYFVDYLKNPKAFLSKGLGIPKGVLFYGPPGTGKTMLAKAVAGESDVTFISAEGNQFLKKYVGEGEETVHNLFATARKYAPSIIFIDEIDAIAKERRGGEVSSDSILTALLAEMDGFKTDTKKPIFVLAATNYEVEPGTAKSLDPAILRRFDRHIYIDLPDKKDRIEFIRMKLAKSKAFALSDAEVENVAVRSTGMSLAQLDLIFEFSLRIAVRSKKDFVDDAIFEEAFESYNYGEEKKWDESELEKTAYHEAGHAFLCWYSGETPSYLTIVARGNHGGYMQHGDNESKGSYSKKMLLDRIRTSLGGRAAELVYYGGKDGLTTGASGDLRTATYIAKSIVCNYGMDDEMGLAVISEEEAEGVALSGKVRDAVNKILSVEMENAMRIISENKPALDEIVSVLLQKNHLGSEEIDAIFSSKAIKE